MTSLLLATSVQHAFAHVTVKPAQVGIGSWQTFSVGVPVEKDKPTIGVRLVIPEGAEYVMPNVKPGWTITTKKTGEGEESKVTEIEWKGGTIPTGQRDEFVFSAKVPETPTKLHWKAYQQYQDGTVVAWDASEEELGDDSHDFSTKGPFSTTEIIDDLSVEPSDQSQTSENMKLQHSPVAIVALAIAVTSIGLQMLRKK